MNPLSSRSSGGILPPDERYPAPATGERPSLPVGEYLFSLVCAALGIYVVVAAGFIRVPVSSNTLGPRAFPYLVGAILIIAAVAVVIGVSRGRLGEAEEGEDVDGTVPTDWVTVGKLVAFFTIHAYLIGIIGWPLAAALLFTGSAWALGARKLWRAALIGLALGFTIHVIFGSLLGLSLPAGPLLDWMPFL
ncbi:tripartite tricarboxylate transporter TctB family protein [Homoserinimonas sp. A447]